MISWKCGDLTSKRVLRWYVSNRHVLSDRSESLFDPTHGKPTVDWPSAATWQRCPFQSGQLIDDCFPRVENRGRAHLDWKSVILVRIWWHYVAILLFGRSHLGRGRRVLTFEDRRMSACLFFFQEAPYIQKRTMAEKEQTSFYNICILLQYSVISIPEGFGAFATSEDKTQCRGKMPPQRW